MGSQLLCQDSDSLAWSAVALAADLLLLDEQLRCWSTPSIHLDLLDTSKEMHLQHSWELVPEEVQPVH